MNTRLVRFSLFFVLLFAAMVLSGCKANFITQINPDGSGIYKQELGFTTEEANSMNPMGVVEDFCKSAEDQASEMPPGTQMRQEERNGEIWCVFESNFASLDDLKDIYGATETQINELAIIDGKFTYDITLDLSGDSSLSAPMDIKWIVTMPGSVTNHNATEVSGRTLTWMLVPGGQNNIVAKSSTNDSNIWWIVGGLGLVCMCFVGMVVIGGVAFFLFRRSKKTSETAQ